MSEEQKQPGMEILKLPIEVLRERIAKELALQERSKGETETGETTDPNETAN